MRSNPDYATENLNLIKQINELKKRNQELKEAYIKVNEELHCAFARGIDSARFDVLEENEKLKKTIEILQKYPMCVIDVIRFKDYFQYREFYDGIVELTKQEYDLLKEVLGE